MWQEDPPDVGLELRQGDLICDVPLVLQEGEPQVTERQTVELPVEYGDVIVVAQCCTIEQKRLVALAPLKTIRVGKQRPDRLASLMQTEPDPASGGKFPMHELLLEPHAAMRLTGDRRKIADLLEARIFRSPETEWLRRRRTARMTAEGRRLVRIKLGLHWARATDEDEEILTRLGIAVGLTPR